MKRRGYTKKLLSERTNFDPKTINKIISGDPGVPIGTYIKVITMSVLRQHVEIYADWMQIPEPVLVGPLTHEEIRGGSVLQF